MSLPFLEPYDVFIPHPEYNPINLGHPSGPWLPNIITSFRLPTCSLCSRHTGFLAVPYTRQAHVQAYADGSLKLECSSLRDLVTALFTPPQSGVCSDVT